MDVYAIRLTQRYGDGILKELAREKRKIKQWKVKELEALIKKYQEKLKEL